MPDVTGGEAKKFEHVRRACSVLIVSSLLVVAASSPSGASLVGDPGPSSYNDPYYMSWTGALPPISGDYVPTTEAQCTRGQVQCVAQVIKEMVRRWDRLECSHIGPFAFGYLLTTMQFYDATRRPGFFEDPEFVNHEDAVFADYYFRAFDAWYNDGGVNRGQVPPAWKLAFEAADQRKVTGLGELFLGANAHINRDLPFVLAGIGLTKPDGTSRKADHDRVNEFLHEVAKFVPTRAAMIYEPTIDDNDIPGTNFELAFLDAINQDWREEAWRKAERLVAAKTDAERLAVAQWIENEAALTAQAVTAAMAYGDDGGAAAAARDAYCVEHWPNAVSQLNITQDGTPGELDAIVAEALAEV